MAVTVAAILAISCTAQFVSRPGRNLKHFLAVLASVEIGKTRLADWRSNLQSAGVSHLETSCHETNCTSSLRVANVTLHRLRLAPLTTADAGIAFSDGIASDVYVALVVQGKIQGKSTDDLGVVVHESNERAEACQSEYKLSVGRRYAAPGDRSWATISMDRCVSADNRAKALGINAGCLTRIGGCKTIESILPQVFNSKQ